MQHKHEEREERKKRSTVWEQEKKTSAHKHIHFTTRLATGRGEGGWTQTNTDKPPAGYQCVIQAPLTDSVLSHWGYKAAKAWDRGWGE